MQQCVTTGRRGLRSPTIGATAAAWSATTSTPSASRTTWLSVTTPTRPESSLWGAWSRRDGEPNWGTVESRIERVNEAQKAAGKRDRCQRVVHYTNKAGKLVVGRVEPPRWRAELGHGGEPHRARERSPEGGWEARQVPKSSSLHQQGRKARCGARGAAEMASRTGARWRAASSA